ncbi:hypothetical protein ACS0TY_035644 [Phlomoides rotata]
MDDCNYDYEKQVQEKLDMAMPWVGLYIAAASTVCTLAMAADVINGFRLKKLWFPSKFFSLNAASLTVLAVATKLPVDLNTNMLNPTDAFAKYTSLIFLITSLANFMTSLGSMNDREILANVVALFIFVITVAGNVCIQLIELHEFIEFCIHLSIMFSTIFLLLLLTTTVSLAVAVPNIKRSLELKYQEKHRACLKETEASKRRERIRIYDQREDMMKYLVMAETSSPQFVMARSVVCSSAASTFMFAAIVYAIVILTEAYIIQKYPQKNEKGESPYGYFTAWILYVQCIGVVVGAIAPAFRWLVGVRFKCGTRNRFKMEFSIEDYWNETLVEWRDSFSGLQIQENLCRKYLHDAKWFILTFFIAIQFLVVLLSKMLLLIFAMIMTPFFTCVKELKEPGHDFEEDDDGRNRILSSYVLRLEGEAELPRSVLKNICCQADQLIHRGRNMQPSSLFNLVLRSTNFNGVGQFDSNQYTGLHLQEPPNCWTLPVVTLTSIAIALPNIDKNRVEQLLVSVREGLSLAKIVEKTLVKEDELVNIRKAADICWAGVVLYKKWLEIDLREMSGCSKTTNKLLQKLKKRLEMDVNRACQNSREVLEELSIKAQAIITKFKNEEEDKMMKNPLNWPARVVAANTMYRISRTVLFSSEEEKEVTDEGLFERLSVMIADILAACLTNLPRAINTMCHFSAIERREERVREAFVLVGKTERIIECLQKKEWPLLDHDKAASIDEWRALFGQEIGSPTTSVSASTNGTRTAPVSQEHLGITILR